MDYLAREELSLCCVVLGEKLIVGGQDNYNGYKVGRFSGVYLLTENDLEGFIARSDLR